MVEDGLRHRAEVLRERSLCSVSLKESLDYETRRDFSTPGSSCDRWMPRRSGMSERSCVSTSKLRRSHESARGLSSDLNMKQALGIWREFHVLSSLVKRTPGISLQHDHGLPEGRAPHLCRPLEQARCLGLERACSPSYSLNHCLEIVPILPYIPLDWRVRFSPIRKEGKHALVEV